MTARLDLTLDAAPLARLDADVLCVGLFEGEQPPRGDAGRADWRLCGMLSDLIAAGRVRGAAGECLLLPSFGRLRAPRVLVLGLGPRGRFGLRRARDHFHDAIARALDLGAVRVAIGPPAATVTGGLAGALLEAAVDVARDRAASLRLCLRVDEQARSGLVRTLHELARAFPTGPESAGSDFVLDLPPLVAPAGSGASRDRGGVRPPGPAPAPRPDPQGRV